MSREIITCENCEHIEYRLYDDDEYENCSYCGSALKTETVYTEEEFQEAIEEYANTKLYQEGYRAGILAEREECALTCEELYFYPEASNELDYIRDKVSSECAEIIRAKGKGEINEN